MKKGVYASILVDKHRKYTMGLLLTLFSLLVIISILIYEFYNKSSSVFMWAAIFLLFGVMNPLSYVLSLYDYNEETIILASLFAIGFCIIYGITRFGIVNSCIHKCAMSFDFNPDFLKQYNIIKYLFLGVVFLIVFRMYLSSGNLLQTSWGGNRELAGSANYFSFDRVLNILYYLLSGILSVSLLIRKKRDSIILGLLILLSALLFRNRMHLLPFHICIITLFIVKIKKFNPIQFCKYLVLCAFAISLIIYLLYGLRAIRYYGTLEALMINFSLEEFNERIIMFLRNSDGDLGLLRYYYFFIENENSFYNFEKYHTYIRMLLVYVPTGISLGIKPPDFAITMGQAVGMSTGGSMHPTFFGDCYANAGFKGVFIGIIWAFIVSFFDYIIIKTRSPLFKIMLFVLFSCGYVIIGRGSVYNGFMLQAYGILFGYFTYCLIDFISSLRIKV